MITPDLHTVLDPAGVSTIQTAQSIVKLHNVLEHLTVTLVRIPREDLFGRLKIPVIFLRRES